MLPRTSPIRVLIAAHERAVRRGVRHQLRAARGIRVIGAVSNGIDAVNVARNEKVHVVLIGDRMPGMSGAEITRELTRSRAVHPVAVIVMTDLDDADHVAEALDAGAVGYLLRLYDSDLLIGAVRAAANSEPLHSSQDAAALLHEFTLRRARAEGLAATEPLTSAERRLIALLASGMTTNEALCAELNVSAHTVRSHLRSAMKKAEAGDRTQLAIWGMKHRLGLDPPRPNE